MYLLTNTPAYYPEYTSSQKNYSTELQLLTAANRIFNQFGIFDCKEKSITFRITTLSITTFSRTTLSLTIRNVILSIMSHDTE